MIGSRVTPTMFLVGADGRLTQEGFRLLSEIVEALNDDARQVVAVADLPTTARVGATRYVPNEAGGTTLVFFDGTNWRRVQDRAIAS